VGGGVGDHRLDRSRLARRRVDDDGSVIGSRSFMTKRALITGITGQDGAYLAEHLLRAGYEVVGGVRPDERPETWRLEELGVRDRVRFVPFELSSLDTIARAIDDAEPAEIYNLAAQSSVASSLEAPLHTADVDGLGVCRLLDVVRTRAPSVRVFQASSADMFGVSPGGLLTEASPFQPRSPYAVAKLFAHQSVIAYRDTFGLFACSAILFNHESPMRAPGFVTRKITANFATRVVRPAAAPVLELGNMATKRDWGFAGDYVAAIHAMLVRDTARDYVLATGIATSIRDFVGFAAEAAGLSLVWSGEGRDLCARDERSGDVVVRVNPQFFRPHEVDGLCGDASRAREELGFAPGGSARELARRMVEADLARARRGALL
jgi:GDPmannose 4,6-dehydratase